MVEAPLRFIDGSDVSVGTDDAMLIVGAFVGKDAIEVAGGLPSVETVVGATTEPAVIAGESDGTVTTLGVGGVGSFSHGLVII